WDAAALEYLRLNADKRAEVPTAFDYRSLNERAKKLVDLGCDDPLVLSCYGRGLYEAGRRDDAEPVLTRALKEFETHHYPESCRLGALQTLSRVYAYNY